MSALDGISKALDSMSLWQLLLGFIACIGYQLAQGVLLYSRGRVLAAGAALAGAAGFTLLGEDWTHATMLFAFAIAGLGVFGLTVWLASRLLGVDRGAMPAAWSPELALSEAVAPLAGAPRSPLNRPLHTA